MRDFLSKVTGFELMGIPFGVSALLLVSMGLGGALMDLAQKGLKAPPILGGPGLAFLVTRGFAQRFFGAGPAGVMASGVIVQGADQQFAAIDRIAALAELVPLGLPFESAEELAEGEYGGQLGAGDLGQGGAVYLTDVERKVAGIMRAQI